MLEFCAKCTGDFCEGLKEMRHLGHARMGEAYFEAQLHLKQSAGTQNRQRTLLGYVSTNQSEVTVKVRKSH